MKYTSKIRNNDKKKGALNVSVSIIFKFLIMLAALGTRRLLISNIGNEANGLSSLYSSIVGFLAVAELGIGSAITFCMYKPIVDGEESKVSALYHLFKKIYIIIGLLIVVGGLITMPFLPYLAKNTSSSTNLYLTFGLVLTSTVLTYAYSSKTSVINAYKNNYITTTINSTGLLLQYGMQTISIILFKSFEIYLACAVISVMLQWLATSIVFRKKHSNLVNGKHQIDESTKKQVTKNIKAMFMHKIGSVLVNTADSLIISAFIGVVILGKYSNYTTIVVYMTNVLALFFTPLTSIIGHLCVKDSAEEINNYFNFFFMFNFIIGTIFFLGYYSIIDNLIEICFGQGLEMGKSVSIVITINYFIQFMRQATLLFRDATGTFYYDRWKPLFEGILNIILSIGFVYLFSWLFGDDYAVVGVIAATIITNLTICHIVEPYVLFKHAFHNSVKKYYLKNYICIAIFIVCLFALHFSLQQFENEWTELLVNGLISVAISAIPCLIIWLTNKDFRNYVKNFLSKKQ